MLDLNAKLRMLKLLLLLFNLKCHERPPTYGANTNILLLSFKTYKKTIVIQIIDLLHFPIYIN